MAFPVYLSPTTASPPAAQIETDLRNAIAAAGGSIGPDGKILRLPDGASVELDAATQNFSRRGAQSGFLPNTLQRCIAVEHDR